MCKSHSSYDVKANLTNWFYTYLAAIPIQWLAHHSFDIDHTEQFTNIWVAGMVWGALFMWAVEIWHRQLEKNNL